MPSSDGLHVTMDPADLERQATRALRALPTPRAPETLVARVMAALAHEARRPWYQRAWRTWPVPGRLAAAAMVVLVASAALVAMPGVAEALGAALARVEVPALPLPAAIDGAVRNVGALAGALTTIWRVVISPVAPYVAGFVVLMALACVAFGTALERVVALGGATES